MGPAERFSGSVGAPGVRAYVAGSRLAVVTADRQVSSSLLTVFFHSSFLKCVSDREGEAGTEVGQAKTRGGSSRQSQFVANDLCTVQGQRMICEACAPTHTSTHNLVLDYISI